MPIIRRVFGPFKPEEKTQQQSADGRIFFEHVEFRWYFHGIRGDHTMAHWVLVFDTKTRKYKASNIPINDLLLGRSRIALGRLKIDAKPGDVVHPNSWIGDAMPEEGTITDILKSKLPPEEIAKATAAAIMRK